MCKHKFNKIIDMTWANAFLGNVRKCTKCDYFEHEVGNNQWEKVSRAEGEAYVKDANFTKSLHFGFNSHGV